MEKFRFYYDKKFLGAKAGRPLRILSEYLSPLNAIQRNKIKDRYDILLKTLPVFKPHTNIDCYSASHLYPIQLDLKNISKSHSQVFSELRLKSTPSSGTTIIKVVDSPSVT